MKWLINKFNEFLQKLRKRELEKIVNNPILKRAFDITLHSIFLYLKVTAQEFSDVYVKVVSSPKGGVGSISPKYYYVLYLTRRDCPYEFKLKISRVFIPSLNLYYDVFLVQLTEDEMSELKGSGVKFL